MRKKKRGNESRIQPVSIADEMKNSYLDYAMSVIAGRALPDVRDGLKPVHRRILHSMNELNLTPDKPYRKSARIVGDVLGKYHPHGDTAVYFAMVRMAQEFSTRGLLVDGHGNFGSVDGDSPAAMRYTEARLSKLATELLRDIDKDTVDFVPNFDESLKEPDVLPSRFPNLLVNGANGIAVGMATSIPPHNLREVIDATVHLIDNKDCTVDNLMKYIKGPDFPTGAMVMGGEGVLNSYRTGRGKLKVRAKANVEDLPRGKKNIIITEIPYQVNKAKLIEKIAELVKDKKVEGIADLRDESNREGMRIVVELKRDVNPHAVMKALYKQSPLEETISIIMLALVNGEPKILNLKEILDEYIKHQKSVVYRRISFDLEKAEGKAHLLEGIRVALDNLDEVIDIIRNSKTTKDAKTSLMERFELSEIQAGAILDMRLQKLTGMEKAKVEKEYKALIKEIKKLTKILKSEKLLLEVIKEELLEVKKNYGTKRLTEIRVDDSEVGMKELIEKKDVIVTMTPSGYIKQQTINSYKFRFRGKEEDPLEIKRGDYSSKAIIADTHGRWLFATNKGRICALNTYEIPEGKGLEVGESIRYLLKLSSDESVVSAIYIQDKAKEKFITLITEKGLAKKINRSELKSVNKSGVTAINLQGEDEVVNMLLTNGKEKIVFISKYGRELLIEESTITVKSMNSMGLKVMTIEDDDSIIGSCLYNHDSDLLFISENGYCMRTPMELLEVGERATRGKKIYTTNGVTGDLVDVHIAADDDEIIVKGEDGNMCSIFSDDVPLYYPGSQGEYVGEFSEWNIKGKIKEVIKLEFDTGDVM